MPPTAMSIRQWLLSIVVYRGRRSGEKRNPPGFPDVLLFRTLDETREKVKLTLKIA